MAKSVFTKHKLIRYFIFLFVIAIVTVGAAIGCYLHFGHAVNSSGFTEDFKDKLFVGKSFSTEDVLKDQEYKFNWIRSSDVEVIVYVNTIKDGVESEEANTEILNYKSDAKTFEVCGVASGYIVFQNNLDISVNLHVPFATKFINDDTNIVLRENNPEFFDDGIVTSSEIQSVKELRFTNAGTYNISDLNVCANLNRFIIASEEIIYFTGIDAINSNIPFYVTDGAYEDYMVDSDWGNYANRVFPIVDLQEGVHTVVFEFNGGQLPSISPVATNYYTSVQEGKTVNMNDYTLVRVGYTFNGWFKSNDNGLTLTDENISGDYLFTSDLKLYAKWSVNHYKVVYNDKRVTNLPAPIEAEYGKTYSISSQKLEQVGYTFWGWATTQNAQKAEYAVGQAILNLTASDKAVINLYAVWTTNRYTLIYNGNGGANIPESVDDVEFDFEFNISDLVPTRKGFTFLGWNVDSAAESAQYSAGDKVKGLVATSGGSMTLYAIWSAHKYNIQYDANGGTDAPSKQSDIEYGQEFSLSSEKPIRNGYVFLGWSTSDSAKEATYAADQIVSSLTEQDDYTMVLYAVWAANTYTIVYNANGGINPPASQNNIAFNSNVSLRSSIPTKIGCTFVGWATEPDATEAKYVPEQTVKNLVADVDGKYTLYAVWAVNSYSIAYDANGGTNAPTEQNNLLYGESVTLSSQVPIRTGYIFLGWARTSTATEAQYSAGQEVSNLVSNDGETLTLYGVWAAISYTIIYNANGGQNPPASVGGILFEETRKLSDEKPTRIGYTFLGWSINSSASSPQFEAGSEVKQLVSDSKGNVTLYAVWSAHRYSIKYDANGGTNAPTTQSNISYDETVKLSSSVPQLKGHKFTGWALSSDEPVVYAAGQSVKNIVSVDNGSVTLYAKYTPAKFKIVYNVNGGQNAPSLTELTYDTNGTITTSSPVMNDGNFQRAAFEGWAFTSDATAIDYAKGTQLTKEAVNFLYERCSNGEVVLYAVWDYWHKIEVMTNGASVSGVTSGAYYKTGTSITLAITYTHDNNKTLVIGGTTYTDGRKTHTFVVQTKDIIVEAGSSSGGCFAKGTLITLGDGSRKKVEELLSTDTILSFNHEIGKVESSNIAYIFYSGYQEYEVLTLKFSHDYSIDVLFGHGFFDVDILEYVVITPDNVDAYIGHRYYVAEYVGTEYVSTSVELLSYSITYRYTECYSILSAVNINHFANGLLAVTDDIDGLFNIFKLDENMMYDQELLVADIAQYGLYEYEDWSDYITYEEFVAFNAPYLKVAVGKGLITEEQLVQLINRFL